MLLGFYYLYSVKRTFKCFIGLAVLSVLMTLLFVFSLIYKALLSGMNVDW